MGVLLETLWELQCLKTYSELTQDVKKAFYNDCQGLLQSLLIYLYWLKKEHYMMNRTKMKN